MKKYLPGLGIMGLGIYTVGLALAAALRTGMNFSSVMGALMGAGIFFFGFLILGR